jgi:hypothetical protein
MRVCSLSRCLQVRTGGALSEEDYRMVCEAVGASPGAGLSEAGLLEIYTHLALGNVHEDFAQMGLSLSEANTD